jgi:VanZ family protein
MSRTAAAHAHAIRRRIRWLPWCVLGGYVLLIYALLPLGPKIGLALLRTGPGAWLLGPGLPFIAVALAVGVMVVLVRRHAPPWAYAALAVAASVYVIAFSSLRSAHLERTHLPEYGVAAVLSWRAIHPIVPGVFAGYAAAAALAAVIGYVDELIQWVLPGRVYDLRDIGMNALGAVLGTLVLAALRAGRSPRA